MTETVTETLSDPIWQADAWLRERKNPDRWGRRDRMEHSGKDGGDIKIVVEYETPAKIDDADY